MKTLLNLLESGDEAPSIRSSSSIYHPINPETGLGIRNLVASSFSETNNRKRRRGKRKAFYINLKQNKSIMHSKMDDEKEYICVVESYVESYLTWTG